MSVKLSKGQKVSLSKEQPGLSKVVVGLGWDAAKGQSVDCDAIALLLTNGVAASADDVIYFANLKHKSGSVQHMGDNLTGDGDGDDEQIVIDLNAVPSTYDKIVIAVNIYKGNEKNQHFGLIENAFIRIVNAQNNKEICIYNLTDKYSGFTGMIFAELVRGEEDWKFSAIGEGIDASYVSNVANRYGLASLNTNSTSSGGCYVATAVYGSYDCPQVWTLRRYRDNTLAKTWYGRAFIRTYYAISPTLVKWFGETKWFKAMWRGKLDNMVNKLNSEGVEDTPYQDIEW